MYNDRTSVTAYIIPFLISFQKTDLQSLNSNSNIDDYNIKSTKTTGKNTTTISDNIIRNLLTSPFVFLLIGILLAKLLLWVNSKSKAIDVFCTDKSNYNSVFGNHYIFLSFVVRLKNIRYFNCSIPVNPHPKHIQW